MIQSNKTINSIFLFLLIVSLALVAFIFFVWNDQGKVEEIELVKKNDEINYWIDTCSIEHDGHTISVSGWGYLEDMPYVKHEVYVKSKTGGFYKLNTIRTKRGDARKFLKLEEEFDKIGFNSSLRALKGNDFTNEIVFTMRGPYGKKANVEYTCK